MFNRTALQKRIIDMAMQRKSRQDIAAEVGVQVSYVYGVICRARKAGTEIPRPFDGHIKGDKRPRVLVEQDVLERLRPHAERRACEVRELACTLITRIAVDGLVDAVLDDTPPTQPEGGNDAET